MMCGVLLGDKSRSIANNMLDAKYYQIIFDIKRIKCYAKLNFQNRVPDRTE